MSRAWHTHAQMLESRAANAREMVRGRRLHVGSVVDGEIELARTTGLCMELDAVVEAEIERFRKPLCVGKGSFRLPSNHTKLSFERL